MEVRQYNDPASCLAAVSPFLETHEAENCVMIGLLTMRSQTPSDRPILCVAVTEDTDIRAVGIVASPFNMLLTPGAPQEAIDLIAAALGTVPGVMAESGTSLRFAQAWQKRTNQPFATGMSERIFRLERVNPVTGVPGQMRPITEADRPLLREWLPAFDLEALGTTTQRGDTDEAITRYLASPHAGLYLWEADGSAVSLAGHTGPTPHGMRIGPVYTPPEERGHGYASALVAALSQQLLDDGRQFCFLFTDLANPTSNHIYQTIGYVPVCDVQVYTFG